jgi:hypothetical protein
MLGFEVSVQMQTIDEVREHCRLVGKGGEKK